MTDTRPYLASLNVEQINAILEVIRQAPDHLNSDSIADALDVTIREARDHAFEIEKLTKAAIEDVREATGSEPSMQLVQLIVGSVWENIHRERFAHGEYGDGLLPGMETGSVTQNDLDNLTFVAEHAEAQSAAVGTAQVATVSEDGGSAPQSPEYASQSTGPGVPPLRLKGDAAAAYGAALIEQVSRPEPLPEPPTDEGPVLRSAPYVHTFGDEGTVPPPQEDTTPYHLDLVEDTTVSDADTTINDVSDQTILGNLIAEAAAAPPTAVSPPFGRHMTTDPEPGSPYWTETKN